MPNKVIIKDSPAGNRGVAGIAGVQGIVGLQGVAGSTADKIPMARAIGTPDFIITTYSPVTELSDTALVGFVSTGANISTSPVFIPDGKPPKRIVKNGNNPLVEGDIGGAGAFHFLKYSAAFDKWELLNPLSANSVEIDGEGVGGITACNEPVIIDLEFAGLMSNITTGSVYTFTQDVRFPITITPFGPLSSSFIAFTGSTISVTATQTNKVNVFAMSDLMTNVLFNEPLDNWSIYSYTAIDGVGVQIVSDSTDVNIIYKNYFHFGMSPFGISGNTWLRNHYYKDNDLNEFIVFHAGENLYISQGTTFAADAPFFEDLALHLVGESHCGIPSGNPFTLLLGFNGGSETIPFTSVYTFDQAVKFPYNGTTFPTGLINLPTMSATAVGYDAINNQYFNILSSADDLNTSIVGWDAGDTALTYATINPANLPVGVSLVDGNTQIQFEAGTPFYFRHISAGGPQSPDLNYVQLTWTGTTV